MDVIIYLITIWYVGMSFYYLCDKFGYKYFNQPLLFILWYSIFAFLIYYLTGFGDFFLFVFLVYTLYIISTALLYLLKTRYLIVKIFEILFQNLIYCSLYLLALQHTGNVLVYIGVIYIIHIPILLFKSLGHYRVIYFILSGLFGVAISLIFQFLNNSLYSYALIFAIHYLFYASLFFHNRKFFNTL